MMGVERGTSAQFKGLALLLGEPCHESLGARFARAG